MKTIKFFTYTVLIAFLSFASCSTDGEDGMDGMDGAQGITGPAGPAGQDGQDGNANVTGVTVDPFPSWMIGNYLGASSNLVEINDATLTEDVVADALVLVYFQLFGNDIWYPMTYTYVFSDGDNEIITFTYETSKINIYAFDSSGPINAAISKVRYFVIPTNDTAGRSMSTSDMLDYLIDQSVDLRNPESVEAYLAQ